MEVLIKKLEIVKIANLASKNYFYQLIYVFPCLVTLFKPNIFIKCKLANIFKYLLINLFLLLKPSA